MPTPSAPRPVDDGESRDADARSRPWSSSLLIDGVPVAGAGAPRQLRSPSTEEPLATINDADVHQCDAAVAAARRAFDRGVWSDPGVRSACMHRLANLMETRAEALTAAIVDEVGTPIALARGLQVGAPIATLRWFADATLLDRTEDLGEDHAGVSSASLVAYRPVGVVGAITAYNYPLLLALNKLGAAWAAGCTVVLLPSPLAPLTTLLLGELVREAGFPNGVLNIVVGGPEIGQRLTTHPDIDKVTFTGSVDVGRMVMQQAASSIKGVVLELGGKSPTIILPGADLVPLVMPVHVRYLRNAGQGCQSPTRILVHADQFSEFVSRSREAFEQIPVGDPWDPATVVGPVITEAHRDRVLANIAGALADGGSVVARCRDLPASRGWFVPSTLLAGLPNSAPICQKEIFGPVGVALSYRDLDEAVAIANDSTLGLNAAVFGPTTDCIALAPRLRAGAVTINGGGGFRPDAPLGGFKQSGVGRELGEWGLREFLEPQHIQWAL